MTQFAAEAQTASHSLILTRYSHTRHLRGVSFSPATSLYI